MEQDDRQEDSEEEPDAAIRSPRLENVTDPGDPVDEEEYPCTLDDHAGCEQREGNQGEVHGLPSTEPPDGLPAGSLPGVSVHSAPTCAPFAATERRIRRTRKTISPATTAKNQNTSKYASARACLSRTSCRERSAI